MRKLKVVLFPLLVMLCAFEMRAQPKAVKPAKRAQSIAKTAEAKLVVSFEKKMPCNDVNLDVALYSRQSGALMGDELEGYPLFKPEVFDEANKPVEPNFVGRWLSKNYGLGRRGRSRFRRSTPQQPYIEKLPIWQWFALEPNRDYKIILSGWVYKQDSQGNSVVLQFKTKAIKIHTLAPIFKPAPTPLDNAPYAGF